MFPSLIDLTMLGLEAQQVIWLRALRLAEGGAAAEAEAVRMMEEKLAAGTALGAAMANGASPDALVREMRRRVRANIKRLSR